VRGRFRAISLFEISGRISEGDVFSRVRFRPPQWTLEIGGNPPKLARPPVTALVVRNTLLSIVGNRPISGNMVVQEAVSPWALSQQNKNWQIVVVWNSGTQLPWVPPFPTSIGLESGT